MTMEELKVKLSAEIKKDLFVNKSSLSKTRNKKISKLDQRTSSCITGCLALTVLGIVFGLPVLSDICCLIRYLYPLQKQKRVAHLSDAQLAKITDPGAVKVNVTETDMGALDEGRWQKKGASSSVVMQQPVMTVVKEPHRPYTERRRYKLRAFLSEM